MEKQTRRKFIKSIGSVALSAGSLSVFSSMSMMKCTSKRRKKPNVILIMTDDQGYGDLGCHGNPYVKTPALDRLYKESVRLDNFHVDPCCSPTRAALLTGQYSARSGVWHTIGGRSLLQKGKITMADVFQANGYQTAIFGKWHLGENYPFRPQDRGFQETLIHGGGSVGSNPDYWGNNYFDDTYIHNGSPEKYEGYCNTIWFNEAIKFIRKNHHNPFFCYLSTNIPHAPLKINNKYSDQYKSKVSDRLAHYYGMITKFDEDMAGLLQELRGLNLEENTILIFLTDNGPCPWFGGIKIDNKGFVKEGYSAGMRGGKIWGYENAHRVPCFIRWPGKNIGGGKDVQRLTAHFDLLPTLMDCCKLRKPDRSEFDGLSILPLLVNPDAEWQERTLIVHNQRVDFPIKYKEYQVLTERWRLINNYQKELEDMESFNEGKPSGEAVYITEPDKYELYDNIRDPGQKNNIAGMYPKVVKNLNKKYEEWWDDVSRNFDKYSEIIVGSSHENPSMLYSHDAHRKNRKRIWIINPERDGKYKIKLYRWPQESNKGIPENRDGNITLNIDNAQLKIGNIETSLKVTLQMKFAKFYVHLKAGTTCLQGWFTDNKTGKTFGAYSIAVNRIGPSDPVEISKYQASKPDKILKK